MFSTGRCEIYGLVPDIKDIAARVAAATSPLRIVGGDTKCHFGHVKVDHELLEMAQHSGVIDYHPAELVIRVRAGTRVSDLVTILAEQNQMLGFEPPRHGEASTIGGVVSAGVSGSRRPYAGAVRDHMLGAGLVLHDGEYRQFGGQVMKNVAGYDVSRLICGAWGSLGVVTDVSLKVLPAPEKEISISLELPLDDARSLVASLTQRVSPLSAASYSRGVLQLRLSGLAADVDSERRTIGGDELDAAWWHQLDGLQTGAFKRAEQVWRLSTHAMEPIARDFDLMDWGFAQRWLLDPEMDPRETWDGEGHWTCISASQPSFQPLSVPEQRLHRNLKQVFDPKGIFNPGRMYEGF